MPSLFGSCALAVGVNPEFLDEGFGDSSEGYDFLRGKYRDFVIFYHFNMAAKDTALDMTKENGRVFYVILDEIRTCHK